MTIQTIALNGTNIEDLGYGVGVADWLSFPTRTYQTVRVAGVPGLRTVSTTEDVEPRIITLRLLIKPTSYTDRKAKIDLLAPFFNGPVSVTRVEDPSIAVVGLLESMPVTPHAATGQAYLYPDIFADLRIVCHDPRFYDVTPVSTTVPVNTLTTLSMGTAHTRKLRITIANGPVTNPIIILKDQSSNEVNRMTLTGQLYDTATATALQPVSLVIDCAAGTITGTLKNGSTFDAFDWLAADEAFFDLRLSSAITGYKLLCAAVALSVSHYRAYWG